MKHGCVKTYEDRLVCIFKDPSTGEVYRQGKRVPEWWPNATIAQYVTAEVRQAYAKDGVPAAVELMRTRWPGLTFEDAHRYLQAARSWDSHIRYSWL